MKPQAFYIENHSSSVLHKVDIDKLINISSHPVFPSKEEFGKWCLDSNTQHCFYTLGEPEIPSIRSSSQNPIKFIHGLIADYDGLPEAIQASIPKLSFSSNLAPTWVSTTFSNKARLVWVFEKPVPTFSTEIMQKFKDIMAKQLKVKSLLAGLDEGAWNNSHTTFELGTNWRQPWGNRFIPSATVYAVMHQASEKAKFKSDELEIPLDAVEIEMHKRFPNRWIGPFVEGSRGVRFWDINADNPSGCTIRLKGVQAWSGESKFMSWGEIFGSEFVRNFKQGKIGNAIEGTMYDGREYWQKDERGYWSSFNGEQTKRRIGVLHGLSSESKKGMQSELSQALTTIENLNKVDATFPCIYMKEDIVYDSNQKFLNISRVKVIEPTCDDIVWGYKFPWLANYIDTLFDAKTKDVFLSWLAHFYQNAYNYTPKRGHALFIAGDSSAGKTFLSNRLVGGLMGGFQDASSYLTGSTTFNESLFYSPVWAVDDAVAKADPKLHSLFTQKVKRLVANPYQEFNPKFKKSSSYKYNGRLIVTMNSDAHSIGMLPEIERSILDKIIIIKANKFNVTFDGADDIAIKEIPFLASFVKNYKIPEWLKTRKDEVTRFGFDSYHDTELLEIAKDSSPAVAILEVLEKWRTLYFRQSKENYWSGTAGDLYSELLGTETVGGLFKASCHNRNYLGVSLQTLLRQGLNWLEYKRSENSRIYKIYKESCIIAQ